MSFFHGKWPFVLIVFAGLLARAQTAEPHTVTDFYYLLPSTYFAPSGIGDPATPSLRDFRKSIIKVQDVKNGYLRLEGSFIEGWAELAIFKQTDGKYLVALSEVGCGPGCSNEKIKLLSYDGSAWKDLTADVLPTISETEIRQAYNRIGAKFDNDYDLVYELPRLGTTIKIKTPGDYFDAGFKSQVLFELAWDGKKFVIKRR